MKFPTASATCTWFALSCLLLASTGGNVAAQSPSVNSFTQTLLKQQAQLRAQQKSGPQTPPAPIPFPPSERQAEWKPEAPARKWDAIVLHHTATTRGSVASIHQFHSQKVDAQGNPWRGIGYHFVIGNGQGMPDGQIEATFRWEDQLTGAHAGDKEFNEHGIGICLIGNFEEQRPTAAQLEAVKRLVAFLKQTYNIPAERVLGHKTIRSTSCPGRYFPLTTVARSNANELRTADSSPADYKILDEDAGSPEATRTR